MCFKKPKLPPKTPEEIQAEQELIVQRRERREALANDLRLSKEEETEAALARALGFVGMRSLIGGARGGAGFMGRNSGRAVGGGMRVGSGGGTRPSGPPTMGTGGTSGGTSGGGGGSGAGYSGYGNIPAYRQAGGFSPSLL